MAKPKKSKGSKKTKKAPAVPKALRKGDLPQPVEDVWAAGVGALAQARKTGGESFDALVALGSSVVDKGTGAAKSAVDQVEQAASSLTSTAKGVAGGAVDTVADRVEGLVEAALGRLGVPGRDEVLALRSQVDALQARVASLLAEAAEPIAEAAGAGDAVPEAPTVYQVTTHDRGWAVQRVGAERASAVHPTKKEALVDARQTARAHAPSRLVVYKADGAVADETTYDAA
jgi:poly(hydroxyalkanoate) granule-associated protein